MNDFSATMKCPVCNKEFFVWDVENYGWKFNTDYFCSYGCMRKVEKKYFDYLNEFFIDQPKKRKLPEEYSDVYNDLMFIRSLVKRRRTLKRSIYKKQIADDAREKANAFIEVCSKKIEIYKSKYSYAVSTLDEEKYEMLSKYVLSSWDGVRLSENFGKSYDEVCDDFISIMKRLKRFASYECPKNRWIRA